MNIQNFQDRSKQKSPTRIYAPGARNAAVMIPLVRLTEPFSKSSESFDLKNAGIPESSITVGIVVRGVSDLWNYGGAKGELSPYFWERATQISY